MRRILFFILFVFVVSFSACTQEYICQCEIEYTGNVPGLPEPVTQEFFIKDKHDEAASKCEANSVSITADGITMEERCQLF